MTARTVRLEAALSIADTGTWGNEASPQTGDPVLRSSNIQEGQLVLDNVAWRAVPEKHRDKKLLEDGDLIVTMSSGSPAHIGKCCVFAQPPDGKAYYFSNFTLRLRAHPEKADPRWLYYWLSSPGGRAVLEAMNSTTSGLRNLNRKLYLAQNVPLPPLPEQRRIAAILDKADAVRRKRQQTLDLADQFLRSAFLDLVNRNGTKLQRLQLGAVALKKRSSFVNGPFGSNLLKSELHDNGVPVIYIRDIRGGIYNRVSTVCVTDEKAAQLSACSVMSGDVLVSKVGDPPGIAAVYPREEPDAVVTQDVIRIRVDQAIALPEYLAAYLNSPLGKHRVKSITVEATRARFSLGAFKAMPIELPSIEVQERFVELLSRTRPMQARLDRLANKSAVVAASLTQRAFRGEL